MATQQPLGYYSNGEGEYPVDNDLEKKTSKHEGGQGEISETTVVDGDTTDPHMHRSLKGRHVSMIAIAGTIGTGLFLVSLSGKTA